MRYHIAFNGGGASAGDALTVRTQQIAGGFNWISHTRDHADLDGQSYDFALREFNDNINISNQFGLRPFSAMNLVNPGYTGLTTAEVMRATFDAGIRFQVADTSVPGYDNPSPNAGIYNPLQPQILMIPRRPTNLFFNVSTPDQWVAEYNDIYRSFWGRDLTYAEILDNESDVLAQYLLKGENDPWMFHQADHARVRLGAEPARRSARPDVRQVRGAGDHAADLAADGGARAAGRRSHALQRVRRVGHHRSQRQHRHRARVERGGGADHRRLRRQR